jgi:hypothetical protein
MDDVCWGMGDLYMKKRQYAEAECQFRLAHRMVPAQFVPLHRLMRLYLQTGQPDKAKKIAVKIVEQPVKVKTNVTEHIKKEANALLNSEFSSDPF